MQQNYDWIAKNADANFRTDEYWLSIKGITEQLNGVVEGYAASPCASQVASKGANDIMSADGLSLMHLLLINAWGDLYTIQTKFML